MKFQILIALCLLSTASVSTAFADDQFRCNDVVTLGDRATQAYHYSFMGDLDTQTVQLMTSKMYEDTAYSADRSPIQFESITFQVYSLKAKKTVTLQLSLRHSDCRLFGGWNLTDDVGLRSTPYGGGCS